MAIKMERALEGRIGLTLYYGFVCALALRRCVSVFYGGGSSDDLSYFHIALYAALAFSSWWLYIAVPKTSDRVAALLFGLFYAIRIGAGFAKSIDPSISVVMGCAVISVGMMAMIIGLKRALAPTARQPRPRGSA
ncbi:MAG: hypothetical protein WBQ09_13135 [Terriglobales bacterium]